MSEQLRTRRPAAATATTPDASATTPDAPGATASYRLSRDARVLLGAQAFFNLGFYAIIPFLTVALREDHGQTAAAIGVILGARTLSQQGLFVVGGVLADRLGSRRLIVLGCLVRAAGFALLLAAQGFATLLLGAVLTGLAGALFSPALEARLARDHAAREQAQVTTGFSPFVWLMAVGELGALAGPVLGVTLLGHGFATSLTFGTVLFLLAALVLGTGLEPDAGHGGVGVPRLRDALTPRFVAFVALASGNLVAWNQLYFLYPLALGEDERLTGTLFVGTSLLTLALWWPVHRLLDRVGGARAVRAGFLALVAAFALPAVVGVSAGSVLTSAALLALGHLALTPTHQREALHLVPDPRLRGAHLGLLATGGGIAVLLGNALVGVLADAFGAHSPVPWLTLAALLSVPALVLPARVARTPLPEGSPCPA